MNPGDKDYKLLQNCLYGFLQASEGDVTEKYKQNPEYINVCQRILKREWERLKEELNDPSKFIRTQEKQTKD